MGDCKQNAEGANKMNKDDTKTKVVFTDQAAPYRTQLMDMATFRYDYIVDLHPFAAIDLEERGRQIAKQRLLDDILSRMVRVEVQELNPKQKKATASINMPLVYDIAMKEKDVMIKELERSIQYHRALIVEETKRYANKLAYLELPWYKKLWRKIWSM